MTDTDADKKAWSFLASEENYQVVRDLQMKNLLISIVGDFAGPSAAQGHDDPPHHHVIENKRGAQRRPAALSISAFTLSMGTRVVPMVTIESNIPLARTVQDVGLGDPVSRAGGVMRKHETSPNSFFSSFQPLVLSWAQLSLSMVMTVSRERPCGILEALIMSPPVDMLHWHRFIVPPLGV